MFQNEILQLRCRNFDGRLQGEENVICQTEYEPHPHLRKKKYICWVLLETSQMFLLKGDLHICFNIDSRNPMIIYRCSLHSLGLNLYFTDAFMQNIVFRSSQCGCIPNIGL